MRLYRVFPWDGRSREALPGGPLHVARNLQGASRHGLPEQDGVFYASLEPVAAIAEYLQRFRGLQISDQQFVRADGMAESLAEYELEDAKTLPDLTEAAILVRRGIRPMEVATFRREITQNLARRLYAQGERGFFWWSALEASWTNATMFESRVRPTLRLSGQPKPLRVERPEVRQAALELGVRLAPLADSSKRRRSSKL